MRKTQKYKYVTIYTKSNTNILWSIWNYITQWSRIKKEPAADGYGLSPIESPKLSLDKPTSWSTLMGVLEWTVVGLRTLWDSVLSTSYTYKE